MHAYVNLFPSHGRINKFHLCFISWATHTDEAGRTADYWQAHCPSQRYRLHSPHWGWGGKKEASLLREARCIFLYLSTKSHKRWTVSRLHTAPDMWSRSQEAPLVNKRETASTYHINTANQIHIFFSYIKDINSEKGLYCIYHHRPVFFRNFGK